MAKDPSGTSSGRTETIAGKPVADHTDVRQVRLLVISGPNEGLEYLSGSESFVVGSDPSADLVLSDRAVSRFHFEVRIDPDEISIRDTQSRNGTFVNGVPIRLALLQDGDRIEVGRSALKLEIAANTTRIPLLSRTRFGRLVGHSLEMRKLYALLEKAASVDTTVLIQGPTGSGKDTAAEAIHEESARRNGPFVVFDCGATPPNLIEAELFGVEAGAFTGATGRRAGAFEEAAGGTVFLDEIGELPLEVQPKLLRAVERKNVQRLGGSKRIPVDVRVIAATHRNLREEVNERRFRPDLYYRLAVLQVRMPALAQRLEDLPELIDALLISIGAENHPASFELKSAKVLADLARHPWPGNVRELRNALERWLAFESADPQSDDQLYDANPPAIDATLGFHEQRDAWNRYFERRYLVDLLARQPNLTKAAKEARIDRASLYRMLSRCGLK